MNDRYDLERFVRAQNEGGAFDEAWRELQRGRKTSHWMWFVFPQIAGLGRSTMSTKFAISSIGEAQAYLQHPVLGLRLIKCAALLAQAQNRTAEQIFGGIDAQKLHSSITLFTVAAPEELLFARVLDRFFGGERDSATTDRL
jgi:uncharacterized protein (DUF1810 family)